jgi:hypothetical protein
MYAKTQLPAPAKSVNTFPTNCCSFSLSIVDVDVEADEDDDELIFGAYAITAKFINNTHLIRVSEESREVVQRLKYTPCISMQ